MQSRYASIATGAIASLILSACGREPTDPSGIPALSPGVQLSISTDPGQVRETCGEIRVNVSATRAHKPVRGVVVNFVPLAGSVFAAAVGTNKDGEATNYWNLGSVFQKPTRLIARAVDEDGTRVLDDTLEVQKHQTPTLFGERGILLTELSPPSPYKWMLQGRVVLLDGCEDPIPNALVTAEYSGPAVTVDPVSITFPTFTFDFPDASRWGEAIVGFRFAGDTPPPYRGYQIVWRSVEVPSVTVTQTW